MSNESTKTLTTLECVILGLIGTEPQSGYSLITTFEMGINRWSASPGSIYPTLKRLEQQGIIAGKLEMTYETRPRKMYTLSPLGEELLNNWLRAPLTKNEIGETRDIVLLKFLFAERRLTREEVLAWLDNYAKGTADYRALILMQGGPANSAWSVHQRLLAEEAMMELDMQSTWIERARRRLRGETDQTAPENNHT
jgi:DNA-binding PadR family transcriptional regulator